MKKLFAFSALLLFATVTFSQSKQIYTNPDFNALAKNHKVLAIIPFKATIGLRPKEKEKLSAAEYKEMQLKEGLAVQSALHSFFLKKKSKYSFSVDFQDVNRTNALLKKNNINIEEIDIYSPEELVDILNVDGIISGTLSTQKPLSGGASMALGMLTGFYGPTNSGRCTININDGESGMLLWKYDKTLARSLGSDINTIINAMMRKSSRVFPYIVK